MDKKTVIPMSHYILGCTFFLILIGILATYASSALKSTELYGTPFVFLQKQIIATLAGILLIITLRKIPFSWIEGLTLPFFLTSIVLLLLIFIPGAYAKVGGAYRWLDLVFIRFQTSELAKIGLIFFLAKNLSRKKTYAHLSFIEIFPNIMVLAIYCLLLLYQPDFGSTVLLVSVAFLMIYIAGATLKTLYSFILIGGLFIVFSLISAPYRLKRVLTFLDPWKNIQDGGFQIIQSYLAFQNGNIFGVGLGESRQKLFFLPEAHTDFILSVIGEETGFIGVLCVCLLFLFYIIAGYKISSRQNSKFKFYLAFGLTTLLAIQVIFNFCVVTGLLPTKGIPLPFISSGATSLVTFMFISALLTRLSDEYIKKSI